MSAHRKTGKGNQGDPMSRVGPDEKRELITAIGDTGSRRGQYEQRCGVTPAEQSGPAHGEWK